MQFVNKRTVVLVTDDRKYHFSVITAESSRRGIVFRFKVLAGIPRVFHKK